MWYNTWFQAQSCKFNRSTLSLTSSTQIARLAHIIICREMLRADSVVLWQYPAFSWNCIDPFSPQAELLRKSKQSYFILSRPISTLALGHTAYIAHVPQQTTNNIRTPRTKRNPTNDEVRRRPSDWLVTREFVAMLLDCKPRRFDWLSHPGSSLDIPVKNQIYEYAGQ